MQLRLLHIFSFSLHAYFKLNNVIFFILIQVIKHKRGISSHGRLYKDVHALVQHPTINFVPKAYFDPENEIRKMKLKKNK